MADDVEQPARPTGAGRTRRNSGDTVALAVELAAIVAGTLGTTAAIFGRGRGKWRLFGEPEEPAIKPAPTTAELIASVDRLEAGLVGKVPPTVAARVSRICATVRETIPRLGQLGMNADTHSVISTATSYLPEAVGGYLRLPRAWADTRPVQNGKTSLMVLCDQLDLLAHKMDEVYDAVCRADADALVAHGQFLADKFGTSSLDVGGTLGGGDR